jgi:hypothetical protein
MIVVVTKSNVHLKKQRVYMDISRRVNANASPDVPKPLYQWGGCASPLIQSFGCTDSARALRRQTAHAPFGDKQRTRPSATNSEKLFLRIAIKFGLINVPPLSLSFFGTPFKKKASFFLDTL